MHWMQFVKAMKNGGVILRIGFNFSLKWPEEGAPRWDKFQQVPRLFPSMKA